MINQHNIIDKIFFKKLLSSQYEWWTKIKDVVEKECRKSYNITLHNENQFVMKYNSITSDFYLDYCLNCSRYENLNNCW